MSKDLAAFGLDKLSVQDRIELIEMLWDSLPEQVELSEIPDWHLAELAKRRAEVDGKPGLGKPWREVLGQLETQP